MEAACVPRALQRSELSSRGSGIKERRMRYTRRIINTMKLTSGMAVRCWATLNQYRGKKSASETPASLGQNG